MSEQEMNSMDEYTIRVRGGEVPTDATNLSLSILHVLRKNPHGFVVLLSVGPKALNSVMTAYRLAAMETQKHTDATVLVLRQSEYIAEIAGRKTKGLSSRIFPIPIQHAL